MAVPVFLRTSWNDLLVKSPAVAHQALIFFGGDVQNDEATMLAHRDHGRFVRWSLEAVVNRLSEAMPNTLIVAVKPCRMERMTFAIYDNFVPSNNCGCPSHFLDTKLTASNHLIQLLTFVDETHSSRIMELPKILVGFSKGVVVLNQLLHDFHALQTMEVELARKASAENLFSSVSKISWLDGGHNGGKLTWLTDKSILNSLLNGSNMAFDVRVTPYQVKDAMRPWIGKEEKMFSSTLRQNCASGRFTRKLYYASDEPNLETHFRVIDTLCEDVL